jgi:hypothetical protein
MNPTFQPYQIPDSVGVPAQLNEDLANVQKGAQVIGRTQAFNQAYTAIVTGFGGDPTVGTVIPGTQLAYNDATQVQRDIYDALNSAGKLGDIAAVLTANPGPTGDGEWWNWSYTAWGLGGGTQDASLKTATILMNVNGAVQSFGPGLLEPAAQ